MRLLPIFLIAVMTGLMLPAPALADGVRRSVGDYELSVGYAEDPPYLEAPNTLILDVRHIATGAPVSGLETSLRIGAQVQTPEVTRPLTVYLRPDRDQPGRYEGVFVAPYLGEYRFRVLGTIEGTPVDEVFTSGAGGLPEVVVAGKDYTSPGLLITYGILGVYLLAMAGLGIRKLRERGSRRVAGGGIAASV
jgi:hypothetical protein